MKVNLGILFIVVMERWVFCWDIGKVFIIELILLRIDDYFVVVVCGEGVIKILILVGVVRFVRWEGNSKVFLVVWVD